MPEPSSQQGLRSVDDLRERAHLLYRKAESLTAPDGVPWSGKQQEYDRLYYEADALMDEWREAKP